MIENVWIERGPSGFPLKGDGGWRVYSVRARQLSYTPHATEAEAIGECDRLLEGGA